MASFPTQPDSAITEANWSANNAAIAGSCRLSGFDLFINAGLDLDVDAGRAFVGGYDIDITGTTVVSLTNNAENRVWLQADGTIYANTSVTPTASTDLLLGSVTTSGGSITDISATRIFPKTAIVPVDLTAGFKNLAQWTTKVPGDAAGVVCDMEMEPGVYFVRGMVRATWTSTASNQWAIKLQATTASEYGWAVHIKNYSDEGATFKSKVITGTGLTSFSNSATGDTWFSLMGVVWFSDTGNFQVYSSGVVGINTGPGYLSAIKIA